MGKRYECFTKEHIWGKDVRKISMNLCAMSKENWKFQQWDKDLPGGVTEMKMLIYQMSARRLHSICSWSLLAGGQNGPLTLEENLIATRTILIKGNCVGEETKYMGFLRTTCWIFYNPPMTTKYSPIYETNFEI